MGKRYYALLPALILIGVGSLFVDKNEAAKKETTRDLIVPAVLKDLGKDYKVRIVYFVPSDRKVKPNYQEKTEVLMRVVSDVYEREMKAHGIKTRGLDFEFGEDEKLKVHLVKAKKAASFYTGEPFDVDRLLNTQQQEIWETVGFSRNRPMLVFSEAGAVAEARPIPQVYSGLACVSGDIFSDEVTASNIEEQIQKLVNRNEEKKQEGKDERSRSQVSQTSNGVLIHELGHIFGMLHDTRDQRNIMMRGYDKLGQMYAFPEARDRPVRFSLAHARMAAASRFFNESFENSDTKPPKIQDFKLSGPAKAGERKIKFSINMSDNKGLGPFVIMQRGGGQIDAMVGDNDLKGVENYSEEIVLECPRPLVGEQPLVYIINVMDVNGNLSQSVANSVVVSD
tara:strand:- start:429 stop:1616 length:1188 start_codon:yes stop_codon:yes gene_type:complete